MISPHQIRLESFYHGYGRSNRGRYYIRGKQINYSEELFIVEKKDSTEGSIDAFKNIVLDSINQLKHTIEFLQEELREKNLLVNTLLLRKTVVRKLT